MDWEIVIAKVIETALGLVATVAIPLLVSVIKKKIDNQIANDLIEKASDTVVSCVRYVNQTYVNGLKAEGKFDKVAQKEAFDKCVSAVELILSDAAKDAISTLCGDIETWIQAKVEADVLVEKNTMTFFAE